MNLNIALLLLVLAGGIGGTAAVQAALRAAPTAAGARRSTSAADQTFSEPGPSRAEKDIRVLDHAMGVGVVRVLLSPAHFHLQVPAAGCVRARTNAFPISSTPSAEEPTRRANTACAESGPVVPKGPCTTSRCTIRPIPGVFLAAISRVPASEVFGGGRSPTTVSSLRSAPVRS